MDDIVTRPAKEISREELYELVWQTPMSKLGAQLATNGPGLAALCRKRQDGKIAFYPNRSQPLDPPMKGETQFWDHVGRA